jgi:hypothetical protein
MLKETHPIVGARDIQRAGTQQEAERRIEDHRWLTERSVELPRPTKEEP